MGTLSGPSPQVEWQETVTLSPWVGEDRPWYSIHCVGAWVAFPKLLNFSEPQLGG